MPRIQNVALADIMSGYHLDTYNAMLIQIVDPGMEFPIPASQFMFSSIHKFEFLDLEEKDLPSAEEFKINDSQAEEIVKLLQTALQENRDVVVHCVAGICRSGAICEVGVMMGFKDTNRYRQPNLLVKKKLMKVLGWSYD